MALKLISGLSPERLMESKIIFSASGKVVRWSGGTTTELFIYPPEADYSQRNFLFRLSTATVEAEESEFTFLAGISRKLMVLAGKVTLIHKDHSSRELGKFEVDSFQGDWETKSVGKCTDFNLMTCGTSSGNLTSIMLENDQAHTLKIDESCDWLFVYVFSGKVKIDVMDKRFAVNIGDLLMLNKLTVRSIEITGLEVSELVLTEVLL
jgi:uncharacterized protein